MPTVEQIRRQVLPQDTSLVTGERGEFNEVSWVVTLRPTPPGFDRLRGNEIALVDVITAKRLGVTMSSLVRSLSEQGVSSIGVQGDLPEEVIDFAQKQNLVIFKIPQTSDLIALEARIVSLIREERDRLYQQEQELTSALMGLALAGRGVNAILNKLTELSGRKVILLGPGFEPYLPGGQDFPDIKKRLLKAFPVPPVSIKGLHLAEETAGFVSPILGKQRTEGYLLVVAPALELEEVDRLAARVGALALAVEMSRRQAVEDTEDKFQAEMLEFLLTGDLSSTAAAERAEKLGLDLARRYSVMKIETAGPAKTELSIKAVKAALGKKTLCFRRGGSLIIIFEVINHALNDMRYLKQETGQKLSRQLGVVISMGMGRSYIAAEGLKNSFQESEQAFMIGKRLFGEGSLSFFGDLGVYRLLLSIGIDELKSFYRESVGDLEEYDREHGGELSHTLGEILKYPTLAETAKALHVHRNTLLYRIQRIQEITNMNLDDGETRLTFHLALKAQDVIRRS
jgi:PucR family transcriptional regulator, purine catabolism regulatory protein